MFPNDLGRQSASTKRNRKHLKKTLPPLDIDANIKRINTFYHAPIGEENFQIKHLEVKKSEVTEEEAPDESMNPILMRPPSVEERVKPLNPRFERKVLYNHERTQRKILTSSKGAHLEYNLAYDTG